MAVAALVAGCGDDNPMGTDGIKPPPSYPALTTPQNTLEALRMAYERRDSVETARVYDDAYQGFSQNLQDPSSPPPIYFSRSDEIRHVGELYKTATISEVTMNLGAPSSWQRFPSEDLAHPDWAVIQIGYHNIEVIDGPLLYKAYGSNTFEFKFAPSTDSTSATDTLWHVVRWDEVN